MRWPRPITLRTWMIIVNMPHKSTANVFSTDDLALLAQLTPSIDIAILSDEVYEYVVFDGAHYQSRVVRHRELAERAQRDRVVVR